MKDLEIKIFTFLFFMVLFNQNLLAQKSPYRAQTETYVTVKDGEWNKSSTWLNNNKPSNNINSRDKVYINHKVTHDKEIKINSIGALIIKGVLDLKKGGVNLSKSSSFLFVSKGLLKIQKDNLKNQKGFVVLNFGGIQICDGDYIDKTRWSGGTFGIGYIFAENGNIENKYYGGFSNQIDWCAPNGSGENLTIESSCEQFNPLLNGNCSNEDFYKRFFDNDLDGIVDKYDIDDDNDGISDTKESNGYYAFRDEDRDGIPNYRDVIDNGYYSYSDQTDYTDSNNDGIADVFDTDLDGIIDSRDLDSDNDGIPDNIEAQTTQGYIAPSSVNRTIVDNNNNGLDDNYETHYGYLSINPIDTDEDGIPDYLDLDTDNDEIFDIVESGSNLLDENEDGKVDGVVGLNGLLNALDNNDLYTDVNGILDNSLINNFLDSDNDINTGGDFDFRDFIEILPPIITQVFFTGSESWIEITNRSENSKIPANTIKLSTYNSLLGGLITTPVASLSIDSSIEPGESILISSSGTTSSNYSGTPIINNIITNLGLNNTIILSTKEGDEAWDNRYDIVKITETNASYVRIDEILEPNIDFLQQEWIVFVDDALNPYLDLLLGGPERHPNAPTIKEVLEANTESNARLGVHRFLKTEMKEGTWNNGYPDRSRRVVILNNYEHSYKTLSARTLEIKDNSKLTLINQALIVSDSVFIENEQDEIRLVGTSQLIQTHNGEMQVTGLGNLYIDRFSDIASIYRYNYLSSPVKNNDWSFNVAAVLKDGSEPTSSSSIPLDINFISGYDGSKTSPISLASYWIYSFDTGTSSWQQKGSQGKILTGKGFLLKGPGVAQNYTFVGTPNDGNITIDVGANKYAFLGNPFPSAINARKFIEDNLEAINGTIYLWDHVGTIGGHSYGGYIGGYATINLTMSLAANDPLNTANTVNNIIEGEEYKVPKPYLTVGQGFFVTGDIDGGVIQFMNSQRAYKTEGEESVFFRQETQPDNNKLINEVKNEISSLSVLKLGMEYTDISNTKLHRQIGISFHSENSFEFEKGYDSYTTDLRSSDIYWKFPNSEDKFIIAGIENISENLEVSLEIIVEKTGEIEIGIDEKYNIEHPLYLLDKVTNVYYSLLEEKAKFNLSLGKYSERFYLTFAKKSTDNMITINSKIYVNNNSKELVINKNENTNIQAVEIFNILGKRMNSWKNLQNKLENRFPINIQTGVYIVKISTNEGVFSKKVMVE